MVEKNGWGWLVIGLVITRVLKIMGFNDEEWLLNGFS